MLGGWGSWVSSLRAGPLAWAEDLVQDIVRDGAKAGVTVLIAGDREVVTARYFASIPNRAYFPTGSTDEGRLAWPRLPAVSRLRGRCVVFGPLTAGRGSVAQFYDPVPHAVADPATDKLPAVRPFRIEPLPTRLSVSEVLARVEGRPVPSGSKARGTGGGNRNRRIIVGVGGDELTPATVRLLPASVMPVLGGPSSGKSSLLATIPLLNPDVPGWLFPGTDDDVPSYWGEVMATADAGMLDKNSVLLVDDADMLSAEAGRHIAALHGLGFAVILTAAFSPSLGQRVPLAALTRGQGTGILIAPRNVVDGDFFGVRFEVEPNPPPGRAVLITEGRGIPVQLPAPAGPTVTAREALRRHGKQN
jgi:S-DNA-T family DNA segregation ATPase FtsK/SpoIIIE